MSGNNVQKSKSPRPIAPAPEKSQPSSASSLAALSASVSFIAQGNEINGKRKLAPRPSDESVKHSSLIKIQPNISKKDSPPSNNGNSNNINNVRLAPAPQQATTAAASTASSSATSSSSTAAAAAPTAGQMMTGSFVLRPVSNQNQRMFPFFSAAAASAHPHLQQRLQATIDANGNIINASNNNNNNQGHQILTENQLHQLQQHHQRNISINQQQQQQHQQQRPHVPIPIAPRPSSLAPTPSTSEAIPSSSTAAAPTPSTSTTSFGTIKPPKICPRPIEKKPIPNSQIPSSSAGSGSSGGVAAGAGMNLTPQSIIPTPQLNAGGALIGFAPNGQPIGYLPSALGVHLQNQQLRFIQPQTLARMQMSHLNPMSIFPHPQQIIHPGFLSAAGGNATYISQGIPNNNSQIPQYLSISGFNPNQIPTSFMNSINSQVSQQFHQQQQQHLQQQQQLHLQQQQQQQPKLIPITPNPSTSMTKTAPSMTMASAAASTSLNLPPLIPRLPPIAPFVPSLTPAISLEAAKPLLLEATSDDDENEPPPLLDRDETVPPSVHEAFVQEAAGVRMQFPLLGTEGNEPLRHVIDGFVIEESSVPFEIDDVIKEPIEVIRQLVKQRKVKKEEEEMEDIKNESIKKIKKIKKSSSSKPEISQITGQVLKKRGRKSNNQNNISNNNVSSSNNNGNSKKQAALRSPSPTKSNRKRSSSSTQNQQQNQQQQNRRLSPTKSIKSPPPERPGSSKGPRKSREIEQLISMDFGPKNPVFKTTSVDEYTKEIKRRQQTSLRPVILQDYKERSPEISREGDEQQCLNCRFTFAQLKLRCEKYPQYCTKECRKEFRRSAKRARQELAEAKAADPSSSSSTSNINEMAAALIGKSPENGNNGMRKRLSNESEASTVSHIPTKSSPLKIRIRSSTDLESPASSSQLLLSPPAASTSATMHHQQMMMMPGPSSTPIIMNMLNTSNGSNGSIPPLASPPLPPAGPPQNPNIPDFARITEQAGLNPQDVNDWSAEDVGRWINAITNSQTNGEIFLTEEIDGSSLFMLTQNQMTSELKVKLGPTLKIVRAIEWLRNL